MNRDDQKTEILSIGDRVFPGDFRLHSRFQRVANFTAGESIVTLGDEGIGRGPVTIVARGLAPAGVSGLRVTGGAIVIDGKEFSFTREKIYRSRFELKKISSERLGRNVRVLEKELIDRSPTKSLAFLLDPVREANFNSPFEKKFVERAKNAVKLIFSDNLSWRSFNITGSRTLQGAQTKVCGYLSISEDSFMGGIRKLKGLGFGLTPAGDDFVAGLLFALNLIEKLRGIDLEEMRERTYLVARGENLLVNTFLALARDNFPFEGLKEVLLSLFGENEKRIENATGNLLSLGETSGSDLAVGFVLTLLSWNTQK